MDRKEGAEWTPSLTVGLLPRGAPSLTACERDRHEPRNNSPIFAQSVSVTPPASALVSRMRIASARSRACSINLSTGT